MQYGHKCHTKTEVHQTATIIILLFATALSFAVVGAVYVWRKKAGRQLEAYISSRGSLGGFVTGLTLFASGMGSWILFGPAEAATWGGVPNIVGYALGSALPLVLFIWIGRLLRNTMPAGHALTEYVQVRFGGAMQTVTLVVMVFYLFIFLAAEVTGLALIIRSSSGTPLWISSALVLAGTLLYTTLGGLRASVFTDGLQTAVILPLGIVVVVATILTIGGFGEIHGRLELLRPELLDSGFEPGIKGAFTLLLGMLSAGLFDQAIWQRVYAAKSEKALGRGLLLAACLIFPVVLVMGWFGLAAIVEGVADVPSEAFFQVVAANMPPAFLWIVLVLGLLLVMSSADSIINGLASLFSVEVHRRSPLSTPHQILIAARWSTVLFAIPVFLIATKGYSVLYLFLVADLLCAAAVVPVFSGLWHPRLSSRRVLLALVCGLAGGLLLLPSPDTTWSLLGIILPEGHILATGDLFLAFVVAILLPLLVVLIPSRGERFDVTTLTSQVNEIRD